MFSNITITHTVETPRERSASSLILGNHEMSFLWFEIEFNYATRSFIGNDFPSILVSHDVFLLNFLVVSDFFNIVIASHIIFGERKSGEETVINFTICAPT